MARGNSKKLSKAAKATTTATTNSASQTSSITSHSPPPPFKPVTAKLYPLTKCLPKDHVVAVHVESTPSALRKQSFVVPVLLNLVIALGLCWRLYHAVPVYLEQMITIMGYETSWTVTPKNLSWLDLLTILGNRTILLSLDYALFGLLGRWPWEFLFGDKYGRYTGGAGWKWNVGFSRPKEIVVRRGRKWDSSLFQGEDKRRQQGLPEKSWTKEEELAVHTKCSDALHRLQTSKNALSLLDKDWDLDYASMVEATELVDQARMAFDDIDKVVLVPWNSKWFFWYPYRTDSVSAGQPTDTEKDERLESFRTQLAALNCEDVFYRWIEILQYETAQPGGFTKSKKIEAEQELRKMIRKRKRDDQDFFNALGGIQNVPGLAEDD